MVSKCLQSMDNRKPLRHFLLFLGQIHMSMFTCAVFPQGIKTRRNFPPENINTLSNKHANKGTNEYTENRYECEPDETVRHT